MQQEKREKQNQQSNDEASLAAYNYVPGTINWYNYLLGVVVCQVLHYKQLVNTATGSFHPCSSTGQFHR